MSTLTSTSSASGPKTKKICMTSVAAGQKRMNDHATMMAKKAAHNKATTIYSMELQTPERMSAKQVSQLVLGEVGVEINAHIIQREIEEGRVGVCPKKMGPQGQFPS